MIKTKNMTKMILRFSFMGFKTSGITFISNSTIQIHKNYESTPREMRKL